MADSVAMKRVRLGALILMVPVAVETVRYSLRSFYRAWRFSFGEPERWNAHWRVDEGTIIEMAPRVGYFLWWGAVILASVAAFLVGLYLLNRVRQGLIFDRRTAGTVQLLGAVTGFAMLIDQLYAALDVYLITRFNVEGPEPVRWFYDPSDLKTMLLAVVLFLFGWVMSKGVEVARENREFV